MQGTAAASEQDRATIRAPASRTARYRTLCGRPERRKGVFRATAMISSKGLLRVASSGAKPGPLAASFVRLCGLDVASGTSSTLARLAARWTVRRRRPESAGPSSHCRGQLRQEKRGSKVWTMYRYIQAQQRLVAEDQTLRKGLQTSVFGFESGEDCNQGFSDSAVWSKLDGEPTRESLDLKSD